MKLKHLVLSIAVVAALGGAQSAPAHNDETPAGVKPTVAASKAATAEEALHIIQDSLETIKKFLAEKNLKALHDLTNVGMAAAKTLQEKVVPPADKKDRFDAAAKQLAGQIGKLHVAADAGDQATSETEFKKAQGALRLVEASIK